MTVLEFLAAEESRDILRARIRRDRQSRREAFELARKNYDNNGAARLIRWASERYQ